MKGVPERSITALFDAASGYRIKRTHYMNSTGVSDQVASRDLKILVDLGLLVAEGETRGRIYDASPGLRDIYLRNYESRSNADPFTQEGLPFPVQGT
jgi:DNA-binding transcriptional ArsR family regulator